MKNKISPKYLVELASNIETKLREIHNKQYDNIEYYIENWHEYNGEFNSNHIENFCIYRFENDDMDINVSRTLNKMNSDILLKIAIDLGIETPDFIPSIPTFRNEIKSDFQSSSIVFEKAFKNVEENPDDAIGFANSALESIIKEILKDKKINININIDNASTYDLANEILKSFHLYPNAKMPKEIKTIGSSLLAISQSIEKIRSDKTDFHGKTNGDYKIDSSLYAYFTINCVSTIGAFLKSFYTFNYKNIEIEQNTTTNFNDDDDIPF